MIGIWNGFVSVIGINSSNWPQKVPYTGGKENECIRSDTGDTAYQSVNETPGSGVSFTAFFYRFSGELSLL